MPLRSKILIGIVVVASLAIAVGLAVFGPWMTPVKRGTSHGFWDVAANVQHSDVSSTWGGDAYVMDEDWAGYAIFANHGMTAYCVPRSEVSNDLDAVVEKLDAEYLDGKDSPSVKGFLSWKEQPPNRRDVRSLVESITRERARRIVALRPESASALGEYEYYFRLQWRQADWYWANFAFEWTYLSSLVLFAVWPGIRGLSDIRWGLHVALLPLLFYLPAYLGYGRMSLYGGAVLYPCLLRLAHNDSCSALDLTLLKFVPPILEPLSIAVSWREHTWSGILGPASAIVRGLWYGGLFIGFSRFCQYCMRLRQQFANTTDLDHVHE